MTGWLVFCKRLNGHIADYFAKDNNAKANPFLSRFDGLFGWLR
jgi:hypothetical protein